MIFETTTQHDKNQARIWNTLDNLRTVTQRILGATTWHWQFQVENYTGQGTERRAFELFDATICKLLLIREGLSRKEFIHLLGLDHDLGRKAFDRMLAPLQPATILGDASYYALSEKGRRHALQGSRFKEYTKPFRIVRDLQMPNEYLAQELHSALMARKVSIQPEDFSLLERPELLEFCLAQAPHVHNPEKGFYLDSFKHRTAILESAEISIGLLEDFGLKCTFPVAMHPDTGKVLPRITKFLQAPEASRLREEILNQFLSENDNLKREETSKPADQIEDESLAIRASESTDDAVKVKQNLEKLRKTFSAEEFSVEFDRISSSRPEEVWIVSPWLREKAFQVRKGQIEKLLKQGCKVIIAYSAPYRDGDLMAEPAVLKALDLLSGKHANLFYAEGPKSHEKRLLVQHPDQSYDYLGSFNLMSLATETVEYELGREVMRRMVWEADSTQGRGELQDLIQNRLEVEAAKAVSKLLNHTNNVRERQAIVRFEQDGQAATKKLHNWHRAFPETQSTVLQRLEGDLKIGFDELKKEQALREMQKLEQQLSSTKNWGVKAADSFRNRCAEIRDYFAGDCSEIDTLEQNIEQRITFLSCEADLQAMLKEIGQKPDPLDAESSDSIRTRLAKIPADIPELQALRNRIQARLYVDPTHTLQGLKILGKIDLSSIAK